MGTSAGLDREPKLLGPAVAVVDCGPEGLFLGLMLKNGDVLSFRLPSGIFGHVFEPDVVAGRPIGLLDEADVGRKRARLRAGDLIFGHRFSHFTFSHFTVFGSKAAQFVSRARNLSSRDLSSRAKIQRELLRSRLPPICLPPIWPIWG
jgi:hypothetical protein